MVHPIEAPLLLNPPISSLVPREAWGDDAVDALEAAGYPMPEPYFVTALPAGMAIDSFHQEPVARVRHIDEGDEIDLGDRCFEVIHLPGHSPGSIGLWEQATGTLFSGDAIYDGPLLDELPESSIDDYCTTMDRLMTLPVTVVHAGHDPSFGRDRLQELARAYLQRRRRPDAVKWLANGDIECLNIDHQREEVVQTMTGLDCGTLEVVGR